MSGARRRFTVAALISFLVALQTLNGSACGMTGEVVAVDPEGGSLWVRTPGGAGQVVELAPEALIRRNGQPCALWALRPVVPGFCHEVQVWLTADGRARLVEGTYPGSEARVVAANRETLTLELGDGTTVARPLAPGFRVSQSGQWLGMEALHPGQWVYALFDLEGRVKKIALPD
ncbi:MAG: hypothetical protein QME79_10500 [Bacillota bacterium]|nr:hypothetical protein [Bacillota bacterium]